MARPITDLQKTLNTFFFFPSAVSGDKELVLLTIRKVMKVSLLYHRNIESMKKPKRDEKI